MCLRRRCIERFWYKRARSIKIVISRMIFFLLIPHSHASVGRLFWERHNTFSVFQIEHAQVFQKHVYKYYDCKNKLTRIQEIFWEIEENISNDSTHLHTRACVNFPFKKKKIFVVFLLRFPVDWLMHSWKGRMKDGWQKDIRTYSCLK